MHKSTRMLGVSWFWGAQVIGWTLFGIFYYLGALARGHDHYSVPPVALFALLGFLISSASRYLLEPLWEKDAKRLVVVSTIVLMAGAAIWTAGRNLVWVWLLDASPDHWFAYFYGYTWQVSVLLFWGALWWGTKYYHLSVTQRQRLLKQEAANKDAQLRMLRYQINPHFLFNTLNSVISLINAERQSDAVNMLQHMSHYLHQTLYTDPMAKVTLSEELQLVSLYAAIQYQRFGDQLSLSTTISPEAAKAKLPSLLLQPIVENCVKHGLKASDDRVEIEIEATVRDHTLFIEITDNGPGIDANDGNSEKGLGLQNTRLRLATIYDNHGQVSIKNRRGHGARVHLNIPLEQRSG